MRSSLLVKFLNHFILFTIQYRKVDLKMLNSAYVGGTIHGHTFLNNNFFFSKVALQ
jgi:hypothetical protein